MDHGADRAEGWQPCGPPGFQAAGTSATAEVPAAAVRIADVDRLLARIARRVAWGGDGQRGSARIEIDLGELAGGVLVVHADEQGVDVELSLPAGESSSSWEGRIRKRLEARGLSVRRFEVQ